MAKTLPHGSSGELVGKVRQPRTRGRGRMLGSLPSSLQPPLRLTSLSLGHVGHFEGLRSERCAAGLWLS